jgi:hypothetical protein
MPLGQVGRFLVGPLFLSAESKRHRTHGTRPHQQPPSAWQVGFNPSQSDLPACGEVASAPFDL